MIAVEPLVEPPLLVTVSVYVTSAPVAAMAVAVLLNVSEAGVLMVVATLPQLVPEQDPELGGSLGELPVGPIVA
jgi:hypothetical protein